jgi:hypothetical protein
MSSDTFLTSFCLSVPEPLFCPCDSSKTLINRCGTKDLCKKDWREHRKCRYIRCKQLETVALLADSSGVVIAFGIYMNSGRSSFLQVRIDNSNVFQSVITFGQSSADGVVMADNLKAASATAKWRCFFLSSWESRSRSVLCPSLAFGCFQVAHSWCFGSLVACGCDSLDRGGRLWDASVSWGKLHRLAILNMLVTGLIMRFGSHLARS